MGEGVECFDPCLDRVQESYAGMGGSIEQVTLEQFSSVQVLARRVFIS